MLGFPRVKLPAIGYTRTVLKSLALDTLNERFGRGTVKVSTQGAFPVWQMLQERKSPNYTTSWAEVPEVYGRLTICSCRGMASHCFHFFDQLFVKFGHTSEATQTID
ncbi:MAG: DUF4113 domain-containing protein [Rhodoferax sp.]